MVGIVLASHGKFATGIQQSGSMVFGDQENVAAVTLMPSEGPDDFRKKLEEAVSGFDKDAQEEVLFLVDLWGGTPFNQCSAFADGHDQWAIVTGLNLPMLIEAYTGRFSLGTAHEIATKVFVEGRRGVRVKPESLQPKPKGAAATTASAGSAALPEGTVVGDGQMKLVHVRIDSRLLHGQVATNWARSVGCNRIIVVSDAVAHDDLRKSLIVEAAPPGVKANVTTIAQFVKCYNDPRFGDVKALVLFENPEDALAVEEAGVPLAHINVGSLAHSAGKTMISQAIAVSEEDVQAFIALCDSGTTFDTKKVPSDGGEDLFALIQKNNMMP
ncbi:PTS sugar transporter subunit IIB [Atopobiaceae bacterium 24-176]